MPKPEADLGNYLTTHPRDRHVFEILKIIDSKDTKQEKINIIREHLGIHKPFQNILMMNFLPRVVSILPEGSPPYNKNKDDGEQISMWQFVDLFAYFVRSLKSQNMNPLKQERLFIDMIESLPEQEAEIFIAAKDGKLSDICSLTNLIVFESSALFSNDEGFKEVIEEEKEADKKKRELAKKKKPKKKAKAKRKTAPKRKPAAKKKATPKAKEAAINATEATVEPSETSSSASLSPNAQHVEVPVYTAPDSNSEFNTDLDLTK